MTPSNRNNDTTRVIEASITEEGDESHYDTVGIKAEGRKKRRKGMHMDEPAAAASGGPLRCIACANIIGGIMKLTPRRLHIRPITSSDMGGSTSSHSRRDGRDSDLASQETPPPIPENHAPPHDFGLLHSPIIQKSRLVLDRVLSRRMSDQAAMNIIENDESAIEELLDAMRSKPHSLQVQERGCAALTSLAKDKKKRAEIGELGGIVVIVDSMKLFPLDADLQGQGCSALGNLAALDSNKQAIISAGCVPVVHTAMDNHIEEENVQERACGVLFNLGFHHSYKELIANAGGIQKIVRAMEIHPDSPGVQHNACCALWNLGGSVANKERIHKHSGVHAIVKGMRAHRHHPHIQRSAIGALRTLSIHHGCKDHIAETGGVKAVVDAMEAHPEEGPVQKEACGTLRNLLFHHKMCKEMKKHKPHQFLEDAADNFPIDCEENATRVLEKINKANSDDTSNGD